MPGYLGAMYKVELQNHPENIRDSVYQAIRKEAPQKSLNKIVHGNKASTLSHKVCKLKS